MVLECKESIPSGSDSHILQAYKLNETISSVRLNVAGHPKRCFVDVIKEECSAERCQFLTSCVHVTSAKTLSLEPTKVVKTNTEGMAQEDILIIEENASEIFFLGEENIMALKDNTSKYQFTHSSFEHCYKCPSNNRMNAGPLPTGPNCPHKLALCPELINKKKLPQREKKSVRDPEKSSRLNLDRLVKSLPPSQNSDNELFNSKLRNCISSKEIQKYLNTQYEQIVNCGSCNSREIVPYEYNRVNQCIFLTMSEMTKVTFKTKRCETCKCILYPDLSEHVIINVHQRIIFPLQLYSHLLRNVT